MSGDAASQGLKRRHRAWIDDDDEWEEMELAFLQTAAAAAAQGAAFVGNMLFKSRPRRPETLYVRADVDALLSHLENIDKFRSMFRMERQAFNKLVHELEPYLARQEHYAGEKSLVRRYTHAYSTWVSSGRQSTRRLQHSPHYSPND